MSESSRPNTAPAPRSIADTQTEVLGRQETGRRDAYRKLSRPLSSSVSTVSSIGSGIFCSWECAKACASLIGTPHLRYQNSLVIDIAAGYLVEPSKL